MESLCTLREFLLSKWRSFGTTQSQKEDFDILRRSSYLVASNSLVLHHIFGFLEFSDLKSCRLVCTNWEKLSKYTFEKHAKVKVSLPPPPFGLGPTQFLKYYKNSQLKLNCFEYHNCYQHSSDFAKVFQVKFFLIRSLTLENILLFNRRGKIKEFNLSRFLGMNLTSLTINSSKNTEMIISQWNLIAVNYLNLTSCKVLVCETVRKIAPKEIHFQDVKFYNYFYGRKIEIFYLEPFVLWPANFITCNNLSSVHVKNFLGDAFFSIQLNELLKPAITCVLTNFHFWYGFINTAIPLTKLTIIGHASGFQWSYLPETVETLILDHVYPEFPIPPPGFLPKLKELQCKIRNPYLFFYHLSSHSTLTKIKLQSGRSIERKLDLEWLPLSVKELHLDKINPKWNQDFQRHLQSLTLVNYPLFKIVSILKNINTNNLFCSISDYPIPTFLLQFIFWVFRLSVNNISIETFD